MKKILCCVYDKKSKTYDGFMLFDNSAQAVRAFRMTCEKNEVFKNWPEDFRFVKIAEIDQTKGTITNATEILGEAIHYVEKKNEETITKN